MDLLTFYKMPINKLFFGSIIRFLKKQYFRIRAIITKPYYQKLHSFSPTLTDCAKKVAERNLVICVFANKDYIPILKLWHRYFSANVKSKCLVIALDAKTYRFCNYERYESFFAPYLGGGYGLGFMQHQMNITRKILDLNYELLVSDIDAIWVKDPLKYTLSCKTDIVFSPGTFQPPEAYAKWGNVLCGGYFLLRPNEEVNSFLDDVQKRMEKEGDQPAINHELLSRNLVWNDDETLYSINLKGKSIMQSLNPRIGMAGNISVALLPNRFFQRLKEDADALVVHPLASKKSEDKLKIFKEMDLL